MTRWIECPYCSHKLFKVTDEKATIRLEIKCPSCKRVYPLYIDGKKTIREGRESKCF